LTFEIYSSFFSNPTTQFKARDEQLRVEINYENYLSINSALHMSSWCNVPFCRFHHVRAFA